MRTHEQQQTLKISGMTCAGCARNVTRLLSRVAGVVDAEVDLARGEARVRGTAAFDALAQALEGAGYRAERP
ncbi:Heavy metal transport/detoxification protein domain protein [mine drainage metagenome]|uniref:Heavy metal transport/detoxification protein domain protein n=1 Tax=mine drainage metagenome TaxID=410659 RepID=T0ZVL1_9ZZZZ